MYLYFYIKNYWLLKRYNLICVIIEEEKAQIAAAAWGTALL